MVVGVPQVISAFCAFAAMASVQIMDAPRITVFIFIADWVCFCVICFLFSTEVLDKIQPAVCLFIRVDLILKHPAHMRPHPAGNNWFGDYDRTLAGSSP
jgi:hypothetical protein